MHRSVTHANESAGRHLNTVEAGLQNIFPCILEMLHGSLWLYTCIQRLAISIALLRPYPLYKLQPRQLLKCFLHIKADPHLHDLTYIRLLHRQLPSTLQCQKLPLCGAIANRQSDHHIFLSSHP